MISDSLSPTLLREKTRQFERNCLLGQSLVDAEEQQFAIPCGLFGSNCSGQSKVASLCCTSGGGCVLLQRRKLGREQNPLPVSRSEEGRVGKEWVSVCSTWWSPYT